jgi:hypothetical protein
MISATNASGLRLCPVPGAVISCGGCVPWAGAAAAALLRGPFDLLICDEAQALKSINAARTLAVYGRGGVAERAERVWILSGTLAPNHPGELWTHYRCLFGGRLDYWKFVERYCHIKQTSFGQQIVGANLARTAELADILRPHILQRRQRDVLPDLPALRWGLRRIDPDILAWYAARARR